MRSFPSSGLPISSRASSSGRTVLPQLQPPQAPPQATVFWFSNSALIRHSPLHERQLLPSVRLCGCREHCSVESQGRPVVAKAAVTHLSLLLYLVLPDTQLRHWVQVVHHHAIFISFSLLHNISQITRHCDCVGSLQCLVHRATRTSCLSLAGSVAEIVRERWTACPWVWRSTGA